MGVNAIACVPAARQGPVRDDGGWTVPMGSESRAPSADERAPTEPALRWRVNVKRGAAGPPALGDGIVVVATLDRAITLLDWETGETIWRRAVNQPAIGAPVLAGDRVYAATAGREGRVYALDLRKGARRWEARVGSVVPPLAVTPGHVFVASQGGTVQALSAADGRSRWTRRVRGVVRCGPVLLGEHLFVATDDSLYLVATTDGEIVQRAAAPATVVTPPAVAGDTLVLTSPDGLVVAVARDDLRTLWTVQTHDPVFGMPAIARDTAFAVTLGGVLWRIPLGAPWEHDSLSLHVTVRAAPSPTLDGVLIASTAGEVLFARGDVVEPRARVDGPVEQPPIVRNGILLVIDGRGRVHTWR
jgi:hypothetical protein